MKASPSRCHRRRSPDIPAQEEQKAAMVQRGNCDPKVSCPACEAPVSMRTAIVDLGASVALLCPHCGELSFPKASTPPVRRR